MTITGNFIGGKTVISSSNETMPVYDPATGKAVREVTVSTAQEVSEAIQVARDAFDSWSRTTPLRRARVLFNFKMLLEQHVEELAGIIVSEHGKVWSDALGELTRGMEVVEFACGIPHLIKGEYSSDVGTGVDSYSLMQPLGVVAGITPFNFPAMVPMWMFPLALACGNSFVLKPPALAPTAAVRLAELLKEAGLPDGVFNVLPGVGAETGQYLTEHPGIAKVSFTGGVASGKKVMANSAASSLKEVTMELGGKSPLIIFDDADLDLAADIAMMANFFSSGQVCTNGTRVFVPAKVKAAFEQKIVERVGRIRAGDLFDECTNFGPLVSFPHRDNVLRYIAKGKAEGARLLCGGDVLKGEGFDNGAWVAPTVFTDCTDEMTIVREEIFGPVMSILTYESIEEAIRRANDTDYGLAAGIVTTDLNRAHGAIHQLEAGICWINSWGESPAEMPVGGYKHSGIGRENGVMTLQSYTQVKSIQVEMGKFQSIF